MFSLIETQALFTSTCAPHKGFSETNWWFSEYLLSVKSFFNVRLHIYIYILKGQFELKTQTFVVKIE